MTGSIQDAINAAYSGDTVIVAPGIYRENIDFHQKNIVLQSRDPHSWATIDRRQRVAQLVAEQGQEVVLAPGLLLHGLLDVLELGDVGAGGDEAVPERDAGEPEMPVQVGKVVLVAVGDALGQDLPDHRQVVAGGARAEDLVGGPAGDLVQGPVPGG